MSPLPGWNLIAELAHDVLSGARWIGKETVAICAWGDTLAKESVRSGTSEIGDKGLDALGKATNSIEEAKQRAIDAANAVSEYAQKIKERLLPRDPRQPSSPCQAAQIQQSGDEAVDGCLVGSDCQATCKSGTMLTQNEITKARANPMSPDAGNDCCARKRCQMAKEGKPVRQITYVNGIQTTKSEHCATLQKIANQTCADVIGIYNATAGQTSGGYAKDAIQTGQDRLLIKSANEGRPIQSHDGRNPAVDSLSDLVTTDAEDGQATEIWAHSQGGAITSLALFDANNSLKAEGITDGLSGVQVESFGAAAPYWPPGLDAEHYVEVNDLTPNCFGLGDSATSDSVRARGGSVIRFSGPPGGPYSTDTPSKDWLYSSAAHHGMNDTYLPMEKQEHGGCP